MEEVKEPAIGDEVIIDGVNVRCIDSGTPHDCRPCKFIHCAIGVCRTIACTRMERDDGKNVHFEEVK